MSTDIFFAYFTVPAFQFLGAMPLAVIKGSMSRLVEPQEQGKFIREVHWYNKGEWLMTLPFQM